jgi:hypothetical protein
MCIAAVAAHSISNTYYFLSWRDEQLVPAMLLYQADLLPRDQELDEVRTMSYLSF